MLLSTSKLPSKPRLRSLYRCVECRRQRKCVYNEEEGTCERCQASGASCVIVRTNGRWKRWHPDEEPAVRRLLPPTAGTQEPVPLPDEALYTVSVPEDVGTTYSPGNHEIRPLFKTETPTAIPDSHEWRQRDNQSSPSFAYSQNQDFDVERDRNIFSPTPTPTPLLEPMPTPRSQPGEWQLQTGWHLHSRRNLFDPTPSVSPSVSSLDLRSQLDRMTSPPPNRNAFSPTPTPSICSEANIKDNESRGDHTGSRASQALLPSFTNFHLSREARNIFDPPLVDDEILSRND
ncbi:hypothetical protein BT69DRAFT_794624 [Atractiella rhizophila]|nr:hypothetical protein BT69DRAFT_794624 [Atractiella rhizophila]